MIPTTLLLIKRVMYITENFVFVMESVRVSSSVHRLSEVKPMKAEIHDCPLFSADWRRPLKRNEKLNEKHEKRMKREACGRRETGREGER